jgi:cytochrome oxidase Cu insertion factor (SCO1/SenC/PrrC family)
MRPLGYSVEQETTRKDYVTETNAGLREGQQMQNFELPDQEGRPFDLHQRLQEGPLVLVFYRGDW